MKSILDRSFHYVPSHATNLKLTFDRVRRRLKLEGQAQMRTEAGAMAKVTPMKLAK